MGHISAITRLKRPQEGPTSGCESGPGATLRHTYDLIDSKTLQGAKNDPMRVDHMRFHWEFQYILKKHHIAFELLYSTVWGLIWVLLEVMLGSVWASWLSWSRLGVILGRPDTILDVLEFCVIRPV